MANHADLTGAELHENKGAATATDNFVATVTTGATVWKKITPSNIDLTAVFGVNQAVYTANLVDVSTAETTYIVAPFACTVNTIYTILHSAITVADATLIARNHSGGSMGSITVAYSGSAAGDIDTLSPVANNTLAAGEKMSIETDGASTTAARLSITVVVTRTS
jgi:hypothetical protein